MKHKILLLLVLLTVPFMGYSQVDDMYFVPRKETKTQAENAVAVEEQVQATVSAAETEEEYDETVTYATGELRDVDEYNRRDTWYNDSLVAQADDEEEGYVADSEEETGEDYHYSKRILRFCAPTVGVVVSSPLYWDLCYGPNSIYWDVYVDGIYAYAFPSCWSSLYWGMYYPYSWGWSLYWGWGNPWYAGWYNPWWYGAYWHRPHMGIAGWHGAPLRAVSRPSLMYREGSTLARGTTSSLRGRGTASGNAARSSLSTNGVSSRRTSATSSQTRSQRTTATSTQRTQTVRSNTYSTPSSRSSSTSSFRSPVRSGSGGFSTPSRSSGGGVSRGRR